MACSVPGCDSTIRGGNGMCNKHYLRHRREVLGPCSVDGCTRLQHSGGTCPMHRRRLLERGEPGAADPEYNRGSARSITTDGYVRLYRPGHPMATAQGWVLEHRMVAHDAGLIRPGSREHVHHRNGNKTDNRPANLEVLPPSSHAAEHGAARALDPAPFVEMRRAGATMTAIAKATGKNSGTVWRVLKRAGVS